MKQVKLVFDTWNIHRLPMSFKHFFCHIRSDQKIDIIIRTINFDLCSTHNINEAHRLLFFIIFEIKQPSSFQSAENVRIRIQSDR